MALFAGFGEYEHYPTLGEKCGVLAYRIMRNHPLPDGNKRLAFFAMLALGRLNGADWNLPYEDQVVNIFLAAAPGTMEEETFVAFVELQREEERLSDSRSSCRCGSLIARTQIR